MSDTKFHEGERFIQHATGETAQADRTAAVMRETILPAAHSFIHERETIALATRDQAGEIWASLLWGAPGFVRVDHERKFHIDLARTFKDQGDPFWDNVKPGAPIGSLLLDLEHRRRYRINGEVLNVDESNLAITVRESYPNCPKYIQSRELELGAARAQASQAGTDLLPAHRTWIEQADTFLIASGHPQRGLDASHRGGTPGFVQFLDDATIRVPDYQGNTLYNTLGNLHSDPHVGLLFLDFQGGRQLQATGRATVHAREAVDTDDAGRTGRWMDIKIHQWRESDLPVQVRWGASTPSPFNPA